MRTMVAAAATLWLTFWLWLAAPVLGLPRLTRRLAGAAFLAESVALLAWSYGSDGCVGSACPPLVQAAGLAARLDIPLLACLLTGLTAVRMLRSTRAHARAAVSRRAGRAARPTRRGSPAGPPGSRR